MNKIKWIKINLSIVILALTTANRKTFFKKKHLPEYLQRNQRLHNRGLYWELLDIVYIQQICSYSRYKILELPLLSKKLQSLLLFYAANKKKWKYVRKVNILRKWCILDVNYDNSGTFFTWFFLNLVPKSTFKSKFSFKVTSHAPKDRSYIWKKSFALISNYLFTAPLKMRCVFWHFLESSLE